MGGRKISTKLKSPFISGNFFDFYYVRCKPQKFTERALGESTWCMLIKKLFICQQTVRNSNQTIPFSLSYILDSRLEVILTNEFRVLIWVFVCSCINSHPFVSAPYSSIKVRVNSEEGHADIGHHLVRISRLFWVCCYYVHILNNAVVTLTGKQFCKPHMSCRV